MRQYCFADFYPSSFEFLQVSGALLSLLFSLSSIRTEMERMYVPLLHSHSSPRNPLILNSQLQWSRCIPSRLLNTRSISLKSIAHQMETYVINTESNTTLRSSCTRTGNSKKSLSINDLLKNWRDTSRGIGGDQRHLRGWKSRRNKLGWEKVGRMWERERDLDWGKERRRRGYRSCI